MALLTGLTRLLADAYPNYATLNMMIGMKSSTSTKHAPYFILFQQEMKLPIEIEVMSEDNGSEDSNIMTLASDIEGIVLRE